MALYRRSNQLTGGLVWWGVGGVCVQRVVWGWRRGGGVGCVGGPSGSQGRGIMMWGGPAPAVDGVRGS